MDNKIYEAKDGERLDWIVQEFYGSTEMLGAVMESNEIEDVFLSSGKLISLPAKVEKTQTQRTDRLW